VEPGQNLLSWANANGVGETNLDRARTTRTFANHPLKSGLSYPSDAFSSDFYASPPSTPPRNSTATRLRSSSAAR
jgi:hypothetical protein